MQAQRCHFCHHLVSLVHVHGHYQCPVCKTNALPCCDGDNCETNHLLADNKHIISVDTAATGIYLPKNSITVPRLPE